MPRKKLEKTAPEESPQPLATESEPTTPQEKPSPKAEAAKPRKRTQKPAVAAELATLAAGDTQQPAEIAELVTKTPSRRPKKAKAELETAPAPIAVTGEEARASEASETVIVDPAESTEPESVVHAEPEPEPLVTVVIVHTEPEPESDEIPQAEAAQESGATVFPQPQSGADEPAVAIAESESPESTTSRILAKAPTRKSESRSRRKKPSHETQPAAERAAEPSPPSLPESSIPARPSRRKKAQPDSLSAPIEAPSLEPVTEETPPAEAPAEPVPAASRSRRSRDRQRKTQRKTQPSSEEAPAELPTTELPALDMPLDSDLADMVAALVIELGIADHGLPVPTWRARTRSRSGPQPGSGSAREPGTAPETSNLAETKPKEAVPGSRSRRRRSRNRPEPRDQVRENPAPELARKPQEVPVAPAVAAVPAAPPVTPAPEQPKRVEAQASKPAPKPLIPIPEDAPQVVSRDGVPTLVRDHRVYPPLFFFGNPSDERRAATVIDELRMASDAGVHLHAYLIDMEVDVATVDEAVEFAAYVLAKSVEVDQEAQVLFRIVFQAPRGWQDKFPNAKFRADDGSPTDPSVCDDDFWNVAKLCLEQFVVKMRLLTLRDHILGVHLDRGEWFLAEYVGYDTSRAAQVKFREWARTRYQNDEVTLRASWFDGSARFDAIQIPPYQPQGSEGEKFIRSSRKQRRYVDYHLFLSDATVHRIGELAYAAKAASQGYFLVGASYGYTFEWSHPSSGHLSLGKLMRTPEIDFIAGPPSYRTREPGGAAPFPSPVDSFALNGKLYISEEDFKTSLSIGHEPDDFNPPLRSPQALESVHWRGAGAALAHAGGVAWMDLWGNGWLRTPSVWERASRVQSALIDRLESPLVDPDVAVFIDERALAYLVDPAAFQLLVQNVRESVLRAGVSAAFYLLSDLAHREKFPESKLYIFLNAWDVRPELRAAIKSRLQRDGKVLFWLYAAGLFDAGRDSLERAREVTGIALKPQPFYSKSGTTLLNRRNPLTEAFPERNIIGGMQMEPSYFAIPEGATVLGEYTQTGLPSFVVKEVKDGPTDTHWTSVFLGEPVVNPSLIRALAQMAGVHVWSFQDDVVHARLPFITLHCTGGGQRSLALPTKVSAYDLITGEWTGDGHNVRLNAVDGSTHLLLVAPRDDIHHMLSLDPARVLHIEKLPVRETNVRVDISSFDVPIMKLDEWIEGGESDEVADEWFLRPQQIVEEPEQAQESPDRVGRRRRRRRGRNDRATAAEEGRGAPSFEPPTTNFDDLDMNVMFRKRE